MYDWWGTRRTRRNKNDRFQLRHCSKMCENQRTVRFRSAWKYWFSGEKSEVDNLIIGLQSRSERIHACTATRLYQRKRHENEVVRGRRIFLALVIGACVGAMTYKRRNARVRSRINYVDILRLSTKMKRSRRGYSRYTRQLWSIVWFFLQFVFPAQTTTS